MIACGLIYVTGCKKDDGDSSEPGSPSISSLTGTITGTLTGTLTGTITPTHDIIGLKAGNVLPSFTLPSTQGANVTLSSFKGNYLIIFGFNTWCHICLDNYNYNSDMLYSRYNGKHDAAGHGFKMVAISADQPSSYPSKSWTQVYDQNSSVLQSYWNPGRHNDYYQGDGQVIILDPDGKIMYGATGWGSQDGVTLYNGSENWENTDKMKSLLDPILH